ncbi:MAG TPA: hypothetical protein VJB38_02650 [Bacteroidota bacterium]|nr:hypothetical protein [Bacteroidota bacterium]
MKSVFFTFALAAAFAVSATAQSQDAKSTSNNVSITGEIIDVKCYTTGMMGGRGPEHEDCAIACIKGGLPVGVVDDKTGDVYTIVPAKGTKGANEALLKLVAKKVKIEGKLLEKGGNKILAYSSIEEAK